MVKSLPAMQDTQVKSLGQEDLLEKGRQSTLAFLLKNFHGQRSLASNISSVQFNSVTHSCLTPCDPMDCSMPDSTVHHELPEITQTHVHRISDAIQPSHPLSSPSPSAFNLSQHQGLLNESPLHMRWPKYWSFSISPSIDIQD